MESLLDQSDVVRQKGRFWRKARNIAILATVLGLTAWGAVRYYYPYAESIKSGKLEYVVYEGLIFKTYEGKLIQSDITPAEAANASENNEFVFSVTNKTIADKLMQAGGKSVKIRYTKYFGAILWRGQSRYIAKEIVDISE